MSTAVAFDFGEARIGVAVTDEEKRYSFARPAIVTRDPKEQIVQAIKLITSEAADTVVLGLPLNLSGQATAQTERVRVFGEALRAGTGVPIIYRDERLTTQGAKRAIGDDRTGKLDSLVAQRLLEDFLTQSLS